jgi:hypothetical protein
MTAGLTIVRAEPIAYGRHGAGWPVAMLQLRSPDRSETVRVALAPVDDPHETPDQAGHPSIDEHLVAELQTAEDPWCRLADVIVRRDAASAQEQPSWISRAFARYPACAVSAIAGADGAALLGLRDGRMIRLVPQTAVRHPYRASLACASFVHFWTAAGRPLTSLDRATLTLFTEVPTPCRLNVAVIAPRLLTRAKPAERLPGLPDEPAPARPVVL